MEVKKSTKANLEKGKPLSILMGLVVALSFLFVSFEWGTKDIQVAEFNGVPDIIAEEEIEITIPEDTPPPPPPPPAPQVIEMFNEVDDNTEVENIDFTSEDNLSISQEEIFTPPVIDNREEEADDNFIFQVVEEMPEFPGGDSEMLRFISRAIRYPAIAQDNGIQGRVTCTFTINQDGSVVDAEVLRGVDPSLDREALRVIGTMPKWKPGYQRGKAVKVKYTLPITFRLKN
ncbi:MAG: energy transducer TonB [Tannerellaceae bacterium]|nr:energy transducer TonB [Tannerellaceae bacterium]